MRKAEASVLQEFRQACLRQNFLNRAAREDYRTQGAHMNDGEVQELGDRWLRLAEADDRGKTTELRDVGKSESGVEYR